MSKTDLSDLDFLMLCAVDAETNTYGTLRMVKEISTFETGANSLKKAQATRGILWQSGDNPVVEHYYFELLAPDFGDEDYKVWDMIADHQKQLRDIFELLSFEGVGFNPDPPDYILSQSMTWFYPSKPLTPYTNDPQFVEQAINFLRNYQPDSDFSDAQRVSSLMTFAKHSCGHEWHGHSEFWECIRCGKWSYLEDVPAKK